jgi:hypothetical protein
VSSTILGNVDITVNKTDKILFSQNLNSEEKTMHRQIHDARQAAMAAKKKT